MAETYISNVDILDEAKNNFLVYAEEVLTDRAIPNIEDGLLSGGRKILWTMETLLKMNAKGKTKKSASVVGSTMASSFVHGDSSCYGSLCKMSQEYLMRYPLIIGKGQLGTQEANGMQAASRYTECKPSVYTDLMMNDFNKNVVPLKETYNGEYMEPVFLPSSFPNALVNGRESIAVSLSHNSLPNNLTEVCNAIEHFLSKGSITIDELLEYMPGPDFPLGGTIINKNDIKYAFETGRSKVSLKIRGDYDIVGNEIIFNSIPYRTYRNKIKEQINKNIDELEKYIEDFRDESSVGNNKLIFTVAKGISPLVAVEKLFSFTSLQNTLSYNMNYIVDGTPRLCSMIDLIKYYCEHQDNVLIKATKFDLDKAEKRAEILRGLIFACNYIDEIIKIIRGASDKKEAFSLLLDRFHELNEVQVKAILDMKLSSLTKLDSKKLIDELHEKEEIIKYCNLLLNNKNERDKKISDNICSIRKKYGDSRRTKLTQIEVTKEKVEKISEPCIVYWNVSNTFSKILSPSIKVQKRNGKGIKNKGEIKKIIETDNANSLSVFGADGKIYSFPVDQISDSKKGSYVIENPIAVADFKNEKKYLIFITKNGLVKKTLASEYQNLRKNKNGTIAIKLKEGDSIVDVLECDEEDIVLATKEGQTIRFKTTAVSPTARASFGRIGIKLNEGDCVIGASLTSNPFILFYGESGYAKKIATDEFITQMIAGKGVNIATVKMSTLTGAIGVAKNDNLYVLGKHNSICMKSSEIKPSTKKGELSFSLIKDDTIKSVARMVGD